jgi:hypothetical protein
MWTNLISYVLLLAIPVVKRVMIALGIAIVSFTGGDLVMDQLTTWIMNRYDGLPVTMLEILNILGLQTGITMLLTAMAVSLSIKAIKGSFTNLVFKP